MPHSIQSGSFQNGDTVHLINYPIYSIVDFQEFCNRIVADQDFPNRISAQRSFAINEDQYQQKWDLHLNGKISTVQILKL